MGNLIYFMLVSADGYVADQSGDFQWGEPDEEVMEAINDQTREIGTYLYGRKIYELMSVWETDPSLAEGSVQSAEFAKIWTAAEKIVYSTTLTEATTTRTRIEQEFDPAEVQRIKDASAADLTIEGPTLAAHALRHGLVDEIHMLVCPLVLGGGLSMLPELRIELTLRDEHRFCNGMVQLSYDVRR
ncbi:dihydrofolate reductase family protein [Nesterenkonia sandarakina]|uniref:Dihydrofolate reductase n=1 Tax=Nesterenkonia sandarakina TaxID=272918 RepID=A0A2T0YQ74_9MICC|nr:dihydrofolate reductase family protein [Nesterenkonia sandarakina]PRZ17564.1 dihydrofolate reductase [Nesterenkonia sandarakina]